MITIGQQLTAPDTGCIRYQDDHEMFVYSGTKSAATGSSFSGNGGTALTGVGDKVNFSFTGSQLIIGVYGDSGSSFNIKIDGEDKGIVKAFGYTSNVVVVGYIATDLPKGEHDVELTMLDYTAVGGTQQRVIFDYFDMELPAGTVPIAANNNTFLFSDNAGTNNSIQFAFDGNQKTAYRSSVSPTLPGYMQVDFARTYIVSGYKISLGNSGIDTNNMETWEFQGLINGTWTTLHSGRHERVAETLSFKFEPVEVQGIRVRCLTRYGNNSWGLDELLVYGEATPAVLGNVLATPDVGWRRVEPSEPNIQTDGTLATNGNLPIFTAGELITLSAVGKSVKFGFTGSRLRIITRNNSTTPYSSSVEVRINGILVKTFTTADIIQDKTLSFELTGLSGTNYIKITNLVSSAAYIDAFDVDENSLILPYETQVSDIVTAVESGWKRYFSNHPLITYTGTWASQSNSAYAGGINRLSQVVGDKISFSFIGTKLRYIGQTNNSSKTPMKIIIDGVEESIPFPTTALNNQIVLYKKEGLSPGPHKVEVLIGGASENQSFQAIDVDEGGRFIHPDEVFTLGDMAVGKRIRAHYITPLTGKVGFFSDLGKETSDFIPLGSANIPNGDFYFVGVEAGKSKLKLIADRNIQHSISWDSLNNMGIPTGVPLAELYNVEMSKGDFFGVDFSNGGLTVTNVVNNTYYKYSRSLELFSKGKYYYEGTLSQEPGMGGFGIANGALSSVSTSTAGDATGTLLYRPNGSISYNGRNVNPSTLVTYTLDDVVGVAIDMDSKIITFTKNGEFVYSTDIPFASVQSLFRARGAWVVNFIYKKEDLSYLPEGYLSFDDLYNIPLEENYEFFVRLMSGGTTTTDKDNEWDKYIIGKDAQFNYSGLPLSWTSTTVSGVSYRMRRGYSQDYYNNVNGDRVNGDTGFRPLLEVVATKKPPKFAGLLDRTEVHLENVRLSGNITNDDGLLSRYSISINGQVVLPLTELTLNPTVLFNIENSSLEIGSNIITVNMVNQDGDESSWSTAVTVVNRLPIADFTLSKTEVHAEDVLITGKLTDFEGDQVRHRVLVNDVEIQPWSIFVASGTPLSIAILNTYLNEGSNKIVIEYRDDFRGGGDVQQWEGTLTVIDQLPTSLVSLTPTTLHFGNAKMSVSINDPEGDKVSYCILINGKQFYPESGFTTPAVPPVRFDYTIYNNYLKIGENKITLRYKDHFKEQTISEWEGIITVPNSAPEFTPTNVTTEVGSKENAVFSGVITDADGDKVFSRILANGKVVVDWSTAKSSGVSVEYVIPYERLNFGSNLVRIELKDDFKTTSTRNVDYPVERINKAPNAAANVLGMTLKVDLDDLDGDNIQYLVKLNGKQIYPSGEGVYTPLALAPLVYEKTFRASDGVLIDSENTIEVFVQDEFGATGYATTTFVGVYAGLMFTDESGSYYSSDIGEVIMYLDMGVIVAGSISMSVPIHLMNKNGYTVENIRLSADNNTLPKGSWVELSKGDAPFLPLDVLVYTNRLAYNDELTFHMRVATDINAEPGSGIFKLYVKADPVG